MNKRGFTLVELLSTITIMTIIATMVCINMDKIFDNNDKEKNKNNEEIITEAACVYIELDKNKELKNNCYQNGCNIEVESLIKEGLIDQEIVDNSNIIHIEINNNEKKCTIK